MSKADFTVLKQLISELPDKITEDEKRKLESFLEEYIYTFMIIKILYPLFF